MVQRIRIFIISTIFKKTFPFLRESLIVYNHLKVNRQNSLRAHRFHLDFTNSRFIILIRE
jgi:hypothetical protein